MKFHIYYFIGIPGTGDKLLQFQSHLLQSGWSTRSGMSFKWLRKWMGVLNVSNWRPTYANFYTFFVTKVGKLLAFQSPTLQSRLLGRFGMYSKCLLQGDRCLVLFHLKHHMCYLLRISGTLGIVYNMFSYLEPHGCDQESMNVPNLLIL